LNAVYCRSDFISVQALRAELRAARFMLGGAIMFAYRLTAPQKPPSLQEVPKPTVKPGEVLVKVAAAGVCHSDLHLVEWSADVLKAIAMSPPYTLGHECTGWIAELGAGPSNGLKEGDPVAVAGAWGCGYCRACRLSAETHCENVSTVGYSGGGLGRDGAMAEYELVPAARLLVPLGKLDPRTAAPLTDAGLTPYHAIKRALPLLVPGSVAVVIGVGGLGHMGVQLLKALSAARVVALDISPEKLKFARDVGADETFPSDERSVKEIRDRLTRGQGAELVLDFVGSDATIALAAKLARSLGQVTVVGLAGGHIPWGFGALPFDTQLTQPYWGTTVELMEVLALAEVDRIKLHIESYPLKDAATVYEKLKAGKIQGRAVLVP
jgi:propanol-preferring alcohol dehydrogenase